RASPLEPDLKPILPERRVIEGAELGRAEIRLHVAWQESIERVVCHHADPWLELAHLEPMLETEIDQEPIREPLRIARADEIEVLVDDRVRRAGPPVDDRLDEPSRRREQLPFREQSMRHVGARRTV